MEEAYMYSLIRYSYSLMVNSLIMFQSGMAYLWKEFLSHEIQNPQLSSSSKLPVLGSFEYLDTLSYVLSLNYCA